MDSEWMIPAVLASVHTMDRPGHRSDARAQAPDSDVITVAVVAATCAESSRAGIARDAPAPLSVWIAVHLALYPMAASARGWVAVLATVLGERFARGDAGITDDLRIIESLAALLLEQAGVSLTADLPRTAQTGELNEDVVRATLQEALTSASAGDLFDRRILFRLESMREGQCPTPRHIVCLMTALAEIRGQSTANFACGSAGMPTQSGGKELNGIEISPEWARLARANLRLQKPWRFIPHA